MKPSTDTDQRYGRCSQGCAHLELVAAPQLPVVMPSPLSNRFAPRGSAAG